MRERASAVRSMFKERLGRLFAGGYSLSSTSSPSWSGSDASKEPPQSMPSLGHLDFLDPDTGFVSHESIASAAVLIASLFIGPVIYRLVHLSRRRQGPKTINGQFAQVGAAMVPVLYLTSFWWRGITPSMKDWAIIAFGSIIAYLHGVQDGRVAVSTPEILLYWLAMTGVYLMLCIATFLSDGIVKAIPLVLATCIGAAVFLLELHNPSRGRKDVVSLDESTIFDKITVGFATKLLKKGSTSKLSREDFPEIPKSLSIDCHQKLDNRLRQLPATSKWRLIRGLAYVLRSELVVLVGVDMIFSAVTYFTPSILALFLKALTAHVQGTGPLFPCIYFAVLLGVAPAIASALENVIYLMGSHTSLVSRASLIALIFRKSLELSPKAREHFDNAKIMNLVNVDSEMVNAFAQALPSIVNAPFAIIISIYQLWRILGVSMLASVAFFVVAIPLSAWVSVVMGRGFPAWMEHRDERTRLTSNMFRNIKSLKLYAWERPFYERVVACRNNEMGVARFSGFLYLVLQLIWSSLSDFIAAAVFIAFLWLKEGELNPTIVFPTVMLLTLATVPFTTLPLGLSTFARALTSQDRVNELLISPSRYTLNYYHVDAPAREFAETSVELKDAKLSWNGDLTHDKIALEHITFSASRGDLVCITGRVGAGKTGLLKALAGEMTIVAGGITVKGRIAYCPQDPWLQNRTLKENILFGLKLDQKWYEAVISACELIDDIKQLPRGDSTNVGERGISLSGGQKARVALARAVYSKASVYLLDDVLSAVDEYVSARLMEQLFSERGILANKTIILATNNVKVLSHASLIVGLQDKRIVELDSFKDVVRKGDDSAIFKLIKEFGHAADLKHEAEHIRDRRTGIIEQLSNLLDSDAEEPQEEDTEQLKDNVEDSTNDEVEAGEEEAGKAVPLLIYKRYFNAINPVYSLVAIGLLVMSIACSTSLNLYLGVISDQKFHSLNEARAYIIIYVTLVISAAALLFFSMTWCTSIFAIHASKVLHNRMLWSTIQAPMRFFETTPLGRLVNRFTGDLVQVDFSLPTTIYGAMRSVLSALMNTMVVITGSPIIILVAIPLALVCNSYRKVYVPSSRKISKMTSAAASPILSHIEESLKGQEVIRTFDRTDQFIEIFDWRAEYWLQINFIQMNLQRWLAFRIQSMTSILILSTAVSALVLASGSKISVGYVAVLLSFAARTGTMVQQTLSQLSQMEVSGVSLERVLEYVDLESEAFAAEGESYPSMSWPGSGELEFKELSVRYKNDMPDVLKNLSLKINKAEKIGIAGRTGSGKSTLTMSIFRILEANSGSIEIDDYDISKVGLSKLRSRLSIIPQDSQIFDGTVRENLDPFNQVDDARVWEVLELCHLKEHFQRAEKGLDTLLTDSGGNLSRGQSQLVCLGRALMHESRVLVLDEATASVDVETDRIVQQTIRAYFKDRTIITIAHRLNTIMDSDRIVVLDAGEIKEFDTPKRLLEFKGLFYSLYNAEKQKEGDIPAQ